MTNTTPPPDSASDLFGIAAIISALGTVAVSIGLGLKRRAKKGKDLEEGFPLHNSYEKLQRMALTLAQETRVELESVRQDLDQKSIEINAMEESLERSRRRVQELEDYLIDHRRYILDQWHSLAEAIRCSLEKRKECGDERPCQACLESDSDLYDCLVKIEEDLQNYRKKSKRDWNSID